MKYNFKATILILIVLIHISYSLTSHNRIVIESNNDLHHNLWEKVQNDIELVKKLKFNKEIELIFALKLKNQNKIKETLLKISSPDDENYGKLYNYNQIQTIIDLSQSEKNLLINFLTTNGITKFEFSGGFMKSTMSIELAEKLLNTEFFYFTHKKKFNGIFRCESYSLPEEVSKIVDFVGPTINFPPEAKISAVNQKLSLKSDDTQQNTPYILRDLYGLSNDTIGGKSSLRQSVTAFLDQYYSETDLQTFFSEYYPPLNGVPMSAVIGPNDQNKPGIEASLDVDYMTVMAQGVPTEFWSFGGSQYNNTDNEPFLSWLYYLSKDENPPLVFSTSYGEDEWSVSYNYAERMNQEFALQALRGITFLFASGDSGVGSCFGECTTFTPQFPSDSPWVTAVGATTGKNPETGASFSSGGFSNRWARPSYQNSAVEAYLSSGVTLPSANLFNASGRAFPDVAAQGTYFIVQCGGITYPAVAGTSCSSPVFGGIVSMINDARMAAGKSPMGFLNPFIYKHMSIFTDILSGNNPGCGSQGFYAAKGWDPITGVGTPNYNKLLAIALSLP